MGEYISWGESKYYITNLNLKSNLKFIIGEWGEEREYNKFKILC